MSFLANIFSTGASSLVEAVGGAIDSVFTSDEERLEQENEIKKAELEFNLEEKKLNLEEKKAYLADVNNARDNQSRVQESEHASWLSKNIHGVLSLVIMGITFYMFYVVMLDSGPIEQSKKEIVIFILGSLSTIATQVVAYFFGSSHGSAEKDKLKNI